MWGVGVSDGGPALSSVNGGAAGPGSHGVIAVATAATTATGGGSGAGAAISPASGNSLLPSPSVPRGVGQGLGLLRRGSLIPGPMHSFVKPHVPSPKVQATVKSADDADFQAEAEVDAAELILESYLAEVEVGLGLSTLPCGSLRGCRCFVLFTAVTARLWCCRRASFDAWVTCRTASQTQSTSKPCN